MTRRTRKTRATIRKILAAQTLVTMISTKNQIWSNKSTQCLWTLTHSNTRSHCCHSDELQLLFPTVQIIKKGSRCPIWQRYLQSPNLSTSHESEYLRSRLIRTIKWQCIVRINALEFCLPLLKPKPSISSSQLKSTRHRIFPENSSSWQNIR